MLMLLAARGVRSISVSIRLWLAICLHSSCVAVIINIIFIIKSASVLNFSKRAFCHASPTVWNSLPQTVISDLAVTTGTFRNRLKSALYGVLSCRDS